MVVEWGDAHVRSGWGHVEHKPAQVESLGYVVKHDKIGISIAKGRTKEEEGYFPLTAEFIPAGMINKIEEI